MTIWEKLLEILGSLLSPDWNSIILLIPVLLLVPVVGYIAWVIRRYATAGPQISRPLPTPPTPAGIHMPGPSLAPVLAAGGAFAFLLATLFIKIVPATDPVTGKPIPDSSTVVIEPFGVLALAVGLVAIVGALLYWGREANREYDALEGPATLPASAHGVAAAGAASGDAIVAGDGVTSVAGVPAAEGPPAGVHVPGPSFRPLLASIAAAAMLLGLVIDPVVFVAGLLMTIIGLIGWLVDARKEYREVEKADATGHLENIPAPRFPTGTLIIFAVLFVGSLLIAGGIVPPRGDTSGGGGGASSPAPASPAPGSPAPSGAPSAAPSDGSGGAVVQVTLTASGIAYDTDTLEVPANTPFQIVFTNNDAGIPHNVAIHKDSPTGELVWQGDIFNGVETRTYDVPALPAGTYGFVCTVHPNMTGTLTAK
jgi:plastocyanin